MGRTVWHVFRLLHKQGKSGPQASSPRHPAHLIQTVAPRRSVVSEHHNLSSASGCRQHCGECFDRTTSGTAQNPTG